jgi:hypothetical protein
LKASTSALQSRRKAYYLEETYHQHAAIGVPQYRPGAFHTVAQVVRSANNQGWEIDHEAPNVSRYLPYPNQRVSLSCPEIAAH